MLDYRESLLLGHTRIGVWGVGHIGYTTMCHFAERGVRAIGTDVDEEKVALVNRGESPIPGIESWLGFSPADLFGRGLARATADWRELLQEDVLAHFICVPTERAGQPNLDALGDVCRKLAALPGRHGSAPPLVVVESTVTPNDTDELVIPTLEAAHLKVGQDLLLGCAPRRDWFATPDRSLRTLARVVGGTDEAATRAMLEVLGIVCENLIPAPDHVHAALVKSVENAYRQMEITLANELSLAYPHLDIRTVLELVGTKWNVGTFHPSFGIGGYCIPLAGHYVLRGAAHPERLTLLQATIASSEPQAARVADYLVDRGDIHSVGILGLSYMSDVKVWSHSPTTRIVPILLDNGIHVGVHDPHYTDEEIRRIVGVESFDFPSGLRGFDAVLVVAGHREYRAHSRAAILEGLTNCRLVLDNVALWKDVGLARRGIQYHVAGDRDWLSSSPTLAPPVE